MKREDIVNFIERAERGDKRALGRLLSVLEDLSLETAWIVEYLASKSGRAHIIGITGIPGSGKSTLISRIIKALRGKGYSVAVVSIDPTSPYSSGSILGDRLRMQEHATDPGVFIRSVTTKGLFGGLSLAALAIIEAFDAMGYDKVIVETVGVGQGETDIMHVADTIVVITMPGAGDDIQALKAGVLEIGDIYVVNKSDKPEASKTYEYMLFVAEKGEVGRGGGWNPIVVKTSATLGLGIRELTEALDKHLSYLIESGEKEKRLVSRRAHMIKLIALKILLESLNSVVEIESSNIIEAVKSMKGFYEEALRIAMLSGKRISDLISI
ncbi:MAG: methylmalonyl Co-A mutase-associated GTPase MeaB [Acidilobaceae archaeon]